VLALSDYRKQAFDALHYWPVAHAEYAQAATKKVVKAWSLATRHALYTEARELNPARWSGKTGNWSPVGAVTLNPERDSGIRAHSACNDIQQLAA